ncbi:MAG: tandem-95 repeat protein [Alphaproteobacteria bacterium]|nr:tandem-95 repeat protein [Alphaproteobacteria bacterium]
MADDLQQNTAGTDLPVNPQLPQGAFEAVLAALAGGSDAEEALSKLQDTVRQSVLDAGGSAGAADHAANVFINTFRDELFDGSRPLTDAADYAGQAMQTAIDTYDPSAQNVSPSDALLAAIASGNGVEEAVSRVVAEMGGDMNDAQSGQVENVFLDELQSSLARGDSPDAAVNSATQAAQTGLQSLQQAEVPVDNPVLSALAGGENVDEVLQDAAQRSGGDADAFINGLEDSLANGTNANQAMNDAQQAAVDSAQARQDAEVELNAADQLAAALASGDSVDQALGQTGGGDAFAAALEDALANGAGAGEAMNQADQAQQQQNTVAQQQSVPLSPADQMAASLASGENVDQVMQAAGGNENFAAALEQSLADGAAPSDAMQSGQQAANAAQQTAQQQSVPLSPADQMAASLASGNNVDQTLSQAGGGDAFGAELEAALANGQSPDQSMAQAGAAQQAANTAASQQNVPADPAMQALAQGGGGASGQEMANAISEVTGTTGEPGPQPGGNPPPQQSQTAEQGQPQSGQPAGGEAGGAPQGGPGNGGGAPQTQTADQGGPQSGPPSDGGAGGQQPPQQTAAADTQGQSQSGPQGGQPAGGDQPQGQPQGQQQTADDQPQEQPQGGQQPAQGGEPQQQAQDSSGTGTEGTEPGNDQTQTAQTGGPATEEVVETVEEVVETTSGSPPGQTKEATEEKVTEEEVTETIQTASGNAASEDETEVVPEPDETNGGTPVTPTAQQGGGGDLPTEEEIEALQNIATAAGGNQSGGPSSNLGFNQLLNPTIGNSGLGGTSTQSTTRTTTTTTTTRQSRDEDDSNGGTTVVDTNDVTPNSAPVADDDFETSAENAILTVNVAGNDSDPDSDALSVTAATVGANSGTVTFSGGSITFDPGADFDDLAVGEDRDVQISYTVSDPSGATDTAILTVTVTGTNDVPTVSQAIDAGVTNEDDPDPIRIELLSVASDLDTSDDLDTDSVVITSSDNRPITSPPHFVVDDDTGILEIAPFLFQDLPNGQQVTLSVSYNVVDGNGGVVANTAQVVIEGRNDAPDVVQIIRVFGEDNPVFAIDLLIDQSDVDASDTLSAVNLQQVANGSRIVGATIDANGNLVFAAGQFEDLDDGESEVLSFTYDVSDGTTTTQNTVQVTINGSNDAPVVSAVTRTFGEDSATFTVDLLAGQSDVDGEPLSAVNLQQVANGSRIVNASIDADGNLIITAGQFENLDDGESEVLSFTYDVSDGTTTTQNTVQVTITGSNDAPSVAAIATTRGEDSGAVSVNLLTGQTDVDVEALSAASLAQTGGRNVGATIDANGNLVFAAGQFEDLDDGESEVLSFTYDVSDGTTTTQNTVQVTINGSNDAPVVSAVTRTFGEDSATFTVDLLAGQSDVDGEPLSAVNLQQVANGSRDVGATIDADGNLVFAAGQFEDLAAGQSEVLSFTYGVSDGTTTTQNTVSVTITGTNDAPTLFVPGALSTTGTGTNGNDSSFSYAAVADFDTFPTEAGTIETWVKTTDSNGALLSYAVPGSPNELWVTLSGGNLQVWLNNSNLGSVGAGSLTDGNWHHVALSFGPGVDDTVLHVDGQPVLSLGATGALTTGGTLVLGSDQDAVGGSFESSQALDAEFDGLRVWNSVRSEANIQATMSAPLDPLDHPDLIAEYGFDGSLESSVPGAPPITLNNAEISSGDALQSGVEDTAIPLTGIVVADADGDVLTVTLTSAQGSLAANPGFGGATVQAVANGISITGTPADVQAAMGTATFTGAPDFFGTANVTVSVDDGTAPTETRTVEVTVTPDNDAPDILGVTGHSALALDGNDGRVEIADVPDFTVGGNSPITVEMWLNPDSVSGLTTIFDKSDRSQADYSTYRRPIIRPIACISSTARSACGTGLPAFPIRDPSSPVSGSTSPSPMTVRR